MAMFVSGFTVMVWLYFFDNFFCLVFELCIETKGFLMMVFDDHNFDAEKKLVF